MQVISQFGTAEETSTYSSSGFCIVNFPTNGKQLPAFHHIRMLQHGSKRFTTPGDILQVQHDYFSNIYTDKNPENNDMDIEKYLDGIDIPKISEQSKTLCDSVITLQEVQKAINSLANNKTPGPDGIPSEFYKTFWTELGNELFNAFIKSFEKCELTKSQKQGIINLIPKKR